MSNMSISTFLVKEMGGTPFHCYITDYMRTVVYRIPSLRVQGGHLIPCIVKETDDFKASIVTAPVNYVLGDEFSLHRFVDGGFEGAIRRAFEEDENNVEKTAFVVIQFKEDMASFPAVKGQCAIFEHEGKKRLFIFDCSEAPAPNPDERADTIDIVLTAVRAELEITDVVDKAFDASCFVTREGQCVYKQDVEGSASVRLVSPIAVEVLAAKALAMGGIIARIEESVERKRIDSLKQGVDDYGTRLKELIEALQREPSVDNAYLRLWYLQLWDRVNEFRKLFAPRKRPPQFRQNSMKDVDNHRHSIAHRGVEQLDGAMIRSLQEKVLIYFKKHL